MPKTPVPADVDAPPDPATESRDVDGSAEVSGLAAVLKKARAASPDHRIEWRDSIAGYGAPAIEAVGPWLADARLAAFAVRVIDRAGCSGDAELAMQVLRSAKSRAPSTVVPDIEWALQHVRAVNRPDADPAPASTPAAPRPVAARSRPRPDRRSHRS